MESAGLAGRSAGPLPNRERSGEPGRNAGPGSPDPAAKAPAAPAAPVAEGDNGLALALATARNYFALTKPRIIVLLLWTTVATMFVANPDGLSLSLILWTCLGGYLSAGGAGAINHFLDRKVDARMERTSTRPLVSGRIDPLRGLAFGITLGLLAFVQLAITVNLLAAVLAMTGLLGYVFIYTAWLKPRTPQNIVVGGAAGAVPPLVGWAAATGGLTLEALYPFAIVFLWTPPHFWALALLIRDEYERTGVPMLPVVRGEEETRRQILRYSVVLVLFTLLPVLTGMLGGIYLGAALLLGAGFLLLAVRLSRSPSKPAALRLYLSSLAYLALLFAAMAIDRILA